MILGWGFDVMLQSQAFQLLIGMFVASASELACTHDSFSGQEAREQGLCASPGKVGMS